MASLPHEESLSAQRSLVLYMDIYRIEQVIRNLITNAVGYISVAIMLSNRALSIFRFVDEVHSERWSSERGHILRVVQLRWSCRYQRQGRVI